MCLCLCFCLSVSSPPPPPSHAPPPLPTPLSHILCMLRVSVVAIHAVAAVVGSSSFPWLIFIPFFNSSSSFCLFLFFFLFSSLLVVWLLPGLVSFLYNIIITHHRFWVTPKISPRQSLPWEESSVYGWIFCRRRSASVIVTWVKEGRACTTTTRQATYEQTNRRRSTNKGVN